MVEDVSGFLFRIYDYRLVSFGTWAFGAKGVFTFLLLFYFLYDMIMPLRRRFPIFYHL